MTTFRLATINLHHYRRPSNRQNNIEQLVAILKPFNLDLITCQEIKNDDNWKKFCQNLSFPYSIYGSSMGNASGNGIASSYPIHSDKNHQSNFICQGGTRSLLRCCLDNFEHLTFGVTHLDHLDENVRLTQIKEFDPNNENIDILMGDMNALTREDYSDDYYQNVVVGEREKGGWEKPFFDLTKLITDEWKYQDAFKLINPQLKDEHVATSRFGTRIDYIYIHPRVYDRWKLTKCEIIDTKGATDHNTIFTELTQVLK